MTGLRNKGALTREIDEFLEDESTDKGLLFIMDIDKFKSINDNYGHDVGDKVIIQFANYLLKRFGDELTGRFGGDEIMFGNCDGCGKPYCYCGTETQGQGSCDISIDVVLTRNGEFSSGIFKKSDTMGYRSGAGLDICSGNEYKSKCDHEEFSTCKASGKSICMQKYPTVFYYTYRTFVRRSYG